MPAVGQDQVAQLGGRLGVQNLPAKSCPDKRRDIARVIQMRMCEQHSVNGAGAPGKGFAVAGTLLLEALKQAAIDQDTPLAAFDQITGSGPGSPKKAQRRT